MRQALGMDHCHHEVCFPTYRALDMQSLTRLRGRCSFRCIQLLLGYRFNRLGNIALLWALVVAFNRITPMKFAFRQYAKMLHTGNMFWSQGSAVSANQQASAVVKRRWMSEGSSRKFVSGVWWASRASGIV